MVFCDALNTHVLRLENAGQISRNINEDDLGELLVDEGAEEF
jgi:DNA-binding TFAR19-related protein (PDSD5 family)